jgi:hypothetical protein
MNFCLPQLIIKNDHNVGSKKNYFINKVVYEAESIECSQTPKILEKNTKLLSDVNDVKLRNDDANPNHFIYNPINKWGNPSLTYWEEKKPKLTKDYTDYKKNVNPPAVPRIEPKTNATPTPNNKTIIDERITKALDKFSNQNDRISFVNKPINGKSQSKKAKIRNRKMLVEMASKTKTNIKVLSEINNPRETKYNKQLTNNQFWLRKHEEAWKISTLKEDNVLDRKQFLICQAVIPKNLKRIKFQSLQTNTPPCPKTTEKHSNFGFALTK